MGSNTLRKLLRPLVYFAGFCGVVAFWTVVYRYVSGRWPFSHADFTHNPQLVGALAGLASMGLVVGVIALVLLSFPAVWIWKFFVFCYYFIRPKRTK